MTLTLRRFILWLIPVVLLSLFIVPHSFPPAPASSAGTALAAGGKQAAPSLAHVSLAFEPNRGQAPSSVRYLAHGPGYTLYLTGTGARMVLSKGTATAPSPQALLDPRRTPDLPSPPAKTRSAAVGLLPLGMNRHVTMTTSDKLPGIVNYFIGNKPSQWHTNIPTFGRVTYHNVYPDIDLVFHGSGSRPEYDWVVRPGGNPAMIRLQVTGAGTVTAGTHGQLRMETGLGSMAQAAPHILQPGGRGIQGEFTLRGNNILGIHVSHYDRSKPLVIDPALVLDYSTFLAGDDVYDSPPPAPGEGGGEIAVDDTGDAYVVHAMTDGVAAVMKLSGDASQILYTTYLAGTESTGTNYASSAEVFAIAVDGVGDAYVVGEAGPDFPVCGSTPTCTSAGTAIEPAFHSGTGGEAFASKLDPSGSKLVYSTYLGGSDYSRANAIAVDGFGNAYIVGETSDPDFPVCGAFSKCASLGLAIQSTYGGGKTDVFISKLNPVGTQLLYSTYLGGAADDSASGVAVDLGGDAYLTGSTSTDYYTPPAYRFPVCGSFARCALPGTAIQATPSFHGDAFVTKLNPAGTQLLYSTFLGGARNDAGMHIAVDSAGAAYVARYTSSIDFPVCGYFPKCVTKGAPLQSWSPNPPDAFVTKLSPDGTQLLYSTYLDGSSGDYATGIAVDAAGDAVVTGWTFSPDFPDCWWPWFKCISPYAMLQPGYISVQRGINYILMSSFLSELNPTATSLLYSTFLGGSMSNGVTGVAVDAAGSAYVTGVTGSPDYPACGESSLCRSSKPALQLSLSGRLGGYVSKVEYDSNAPSLPVITPVIWGIPGANGWYTDRSTVVVKWWVVPLSPATSQTGCNATTISDDTPGITLTCKATDAAGTGWRSVTIKRDTVAPSIKVTGVSAGPPRSATLTVQDATSGIATIQAVSATTSNCVVTGTTSFTPGTTAPVQVTAARQNNATSCHLTLQATDEAGNSTTLDPAILLTSVGPQSPATDRLTNVAGTDSQITVVNGTPGMQTLMVLVNGHLFPLTRLQKGETRVVDVSSAMHEGDTNSVIVLGTGGPGATAAVLLGPPSGIGSSQ